MPERAVDVCPSEPRAAPCLRRKLPDTEFFPEYREGAIDGTRADERQPRDGCFARGRAVGAQIGDERFGVSGRRRLDRHGVIKAERRGWKLVEVRG